MIKPPVKATDALEKPPAANPLRSRWIPEDDPKPRENTSYKKVPKQFNFTDGISNTYLHIPSSLTATCLVKKEIASTS